MRIIHTSEMESGQIYIPFINWLLYVSVVIVIINFEHSSNLAAAYGIGNGNHGIDHDSSLRSRVKTGAGISSLSRLPYRLYEH